MVLFYLINMYAFTDAISIFYIEIFNYILPIL